MEQTYLYPNDFDMTLYASQLLQAEAMRCGGGTFQEKPGQVHGLRDLAVKRLLARGELVHDRLLWQVEGGPVLRKAVFCTADDILCGRGNVKPESQCERSAIPSGKIHYAVRM